MRTYPIAAMAIAVALISGCARPGGQPSQATSAGQAAAVTSKTVHGTWHAEPARPGEIVYAAAGIRTMPAPADANPAVTLARAQAIATGTSPVSVGLDGPRVALRMVQTGDFANSTLAKPRLEWVVTFPDVPAVAFGAGSMDSTPSPSTTYLCPLIVFVDADTGANLGAFQSCG